MPTSDPSTRRRRWVAPLVVAITVPALALSAVSTWRIWHLPTPVAGSVAGSRTSPQSRTTSSPTLERRLQEVEILARRSQAVTDHDEKAYLQDLDATDPALRARQKAIFAGLIKLRFDSFDYNRVGVSLTHDLPASAYSVPFDVEAVETSYAIAGHDTGPAVEAMGVTFVQRQGRWWFASDTDVDRKLPAAGHAEPWDDGEIGVAKGAHSLVIGQAEDQGTLRQVATAVDRAVVADEKFWPVIHSDDEGRWRGRVVVYLPRANREFTSLFRGSSQSADGVVAVAIQVYDHISWRADGRAYGAVEGSRVIINPKYFKPHSSYFSVILRHEVSHIAAERITGASTPSWLVEGLAEYVGWRQPDPSRTFFARGVDRRTAAAVNARTFALRLPSSKSFYNGSNATISEHYTDGFLACAYIQHEYGETRLKQFARRAGAGENAAREHAVLAAALHRTFGLTQRELEDRVTAWLRSYRIG